MCAFPQKKKSRVFHDECPHLSWKTILVWELGKEVTEPRACLENKHVLWRKERTMMMMMMMRERKKTSKQAVNICIFAIDYKRKKETERVDGLHFFLLVVSRERREKGERLLCSSD